MRSDRECLDRIEEIARKYYQSDMEPEDAMREIVAIFKPLWD
jgi:hypothetical protein